jgi:cyclase
MTKRVLSVLVFGSFLGAAGASAQATLQVDKISEGIWAAQPSEGANVGWFVSGDGVVVVDAGATPAIARALLEKIAETAKKPVKVLVLTHSHKDHVGGARVLAAAGARVICHENAATTIASFLKASPDPKDSADAKVSTPSIESFSERMLLFTGSEQVNLYWLGPAHTNADVVAYLPKEKTLFSGDIAINAPIPYMQSPDCDPPGWERALVRLTRLQIEHIVPGHGIPGPGDGVQTTGAYVQKTLRLARMLIQEKIPEEFYIPKASEPEYRIEGVPLDDQHLANVKAVVRFEREHPQSASPETKTPPGKKG